MPITLDGTNGITTPTYGGADTSEYLVPVTAFKNRIINGNMSIDQRNAGASVTLTNSSTYVIDRFYTNRVGGSATFTCQQSTTAPAGFKNSYQITVGTGAAPNATDENSFSQKIEGFNTADLDFGNANAKTITLSFWVRSSLTGTFGVTFMNSAFNRSYVSSYSISAANTWEYKTITVAGDTSGTWIGATNGVGLVVNWDVGMGSTYSGSTTTAWQTSGYIAGLTGGVKLAATAGATFYITGCQLEIGSTATSFDYRPYGTELALCQRYFEKSYNQDQALGSITSNGLLGFSVDGLSSGTRTGSAWQSFAVVKRTAATMTYYSGATGASGKVRDYNNGADVNAGANSIGTANFSYFASTAVGAQTSTNIAGCWSVSAEL